MPTSGSYTFNMTRDQIILDAMYMIGAAGVGETPSDNDLQYCARQLNMLCKELEAEALHVWSTVFQGTLYLQPGQTSYTLSSTSSDHASVSVVETTLTNSYDATDVALVVGTVSGMTVGDHIGIQLDTNYVYWTTISTINSGTKTVTIPNPGLESAAAAGNQVYTYTTPLVRPLKIIDARRRDNTNLDVELTLMGSLEYANLPNKILPANAQPTSFYYHPLLTEGIFYCWPTPCDGSSRIKFTYERTLQDLVNASDTLDFPQEWYSPVLWLLAIRIAPAFGAAAQIDRLAPIAEKMLTKVLTWDGEYASVSFRPDYRS